ncbi:MAG: DedA family protein [Sphingomonas sp.]|nr:DedA family protein [Sphingomonas sp.]
MVGLLVPATAIMITFGGLVGTGVLDPLPIYLWAVTGAILGDWVSYLIGRRIGPSVQRWRIMQKHRSTVARARLFFQKYGVAAVFLGRFLGPIRATIPLIAGAMGMGHWPFQVANVLSAIVWVPVLLAPGYLAARKMGSIDDMPIEYLVGFGVLIVAMTLGAGAISAWLVGGRRKRRAAERT